MNKGVLFWLVSGCIALFMTLLGAVYADSEWSQLTFLVAVAAVLMAVSIWVRAERRLPLLCDPMVLFMAFQTQFFVIGAFALPFSSFSSRMNATPETSTRAMLCFLLMIAAYLAGYQSRIGPDIAALLPDFRGRRGKLPGRWFETFIVGGCVLGIVAYVVDLGGLSSIARSGYGRVKGGSGFYQIPIYVAMVGTLLMAWRLMVSRTASALERVFFWVLLVVETLFFGFFLGARKLLFFLFFGLLSMWVLRRSRSKAPRYAAIALLPVLLFYFGAWGIVRVTPLEDLLHAKGGGAPVGESSRAVFEGYVGGVAEPFAVACLIVDVFPDTEPYRYGRTLLVTVLGFIPRAVWADKPVGLGKDLTRYTDGIFYKHTYGHSLTPTLVGDFYANLGWFGVMLGGLLFGVGCRTVAAYMATDLQDGEQRSASRVLIGAVFIAGLVEVRSDMATLGVFYGLTYPALLLALIAFRLDYDSTPAA